LKHLLHLKFVYILNIKPLTNKNSYIIESKQLYSQQFYYFLFFYKYLYHNKNKILKITIHNKLTIFKYRNKLRSFLRAPY